MGGEGGQGSRGEPVRVNTPGLNTNVGLNRNAHIGGSLARFAFHSFRSFRQHCVGKTSAVAIWEILWLISPCSEGAQEGDFACSPVKLFIPADSSRCAIV